MRITDFTNPLQTILVSCRYLGKDNIITLDWHLPLSFAPMIYGISVGKTRYSLKLIEQSGVFTVNYMNPDYEKSVLCCGRNSGKNIDKFSHCALTKIEANKIDCPRLKEATAFLECVLINKLEIGDHVLFIAKVVNTGKNSDNKRIFHVKEDEFTTTKD